MLRILTHIPTQAFCINGLFEGSPKITNVPSSAANFITSPVEFFSNN